MKLLMFVEQAYSFGVLEPVAQEAARRGDDVAWFALPSARGTAQGTCLTTLLDARRYGADAVLVPGNWVPRGLGRFAVQIFHGLALEKKGHLRIRGFFDLYCTPGPSVTAHYRAEAARLGHFAVAETGWPKLDPFAADANRPQPPHSPLRVLYAPTFSPALTSLPMLLPVWERLARDPRFDVKVKFHPLTDPDVADAYRKALPPDCILPAEGNVLDHILWCDLVASDTSSTIREAQWIGRPVVTFRTSTPTLPVSDVTDPDAMEAALLAAATNHETLRARGRDGLAEIHPYQDGLSSARVLDAVRNLHVNPPVLRRKPLNLLRRAKVWWRMTSIERTSYDELRNQRRERKTDHHIRHL